MSALCIYTIKRDNIVDGSLFQKLKQLCTTQKRKVNFPLKFTDDYGSSGTTVSMCDPQHVRPPRRIVKKAPIIGAKFAENPFITGKNFVILKKNGHFPSKWR